MRFGTSEMQLICVTLRVRSSSLTRTAKSKIQALKNTQSWYHKHSCPTPNCPNIQEDINFITSIIFISGFSIFKTQVLYITICYDNDRAGGSVVVRALRYKTAGPGIDSKLGIYSVLADISRCPGVDSASKTEHQDIPGGKGGRCVMVTTLPPSCAECLVIWSLNGPEPSRPHRPVIGVALPLRQ